MIELLLKNDENRKVYKDDLRLKSTVTSKNVLWESAYDSDIGNYTPLVNSEFGRKVILLIFDDSIKRLKGTRINKNPYKEYPTIGRRSDHYLYSCERNHILDLMLDNNDLDKTHQINKINYRFLNSKKDNSIVETMNSGLIKAINDINNRIVWLNNIGHNT